LPNSSKSEARAIISFAVRDLDMKESRFVMARHFTYVSLILPQSSPEIISNHHFPLLILDEHDLMYGFNSHPSKIGFE
jgi:hypothetical protein